MLKVSSFIMDYFYTIYFFNTCNNIDLIYERLQTRHHQVENQEAAPPVGGPRMGVPVELANQLFTVNYRM